MKSSDYLIQPSAWLSLSLIVCGLASHAAPSRSTNADRGSATEASVSSQIVETEIPKSVFVIPSSPQGGRDPFYPDSSRPYASATPVVSTNRAPSLSEVVLKGLSGTSQSPLAVINDYTFGPGDERDVNTPSGRVRIHCLEIREDSVLVEIGGIRHELRLRSGRLR